LTAACASDILDRMMKLGPQFMVYRLPFTPYAVKDHLGSVDALVDANGQLAASYTYDAWGNILSHFRTLELPNFSGRYLFQGREYSVATGLYNFRARWYDPETGRWLSKDPIGLEGGLNLYVFCDDDPMNFMDPFGLDKTYVGKARVLKGNSATIGKPGGLSGNEPVPVTAGSAAVDPAQWGGKKTIRKNGNKIRGKIVGEEECFNEITDVIGGKSPIPGTNVREALKKLNPGLLIIELPSGKKDYGIKDVEITLPDSMPPPSGFKEK